ncbi:SgcJ/EcaC family oxidoreductase [Paenibacillus nanensis]|uniref:SgcJ/EcaC family oxidoreductase n=1 Tax=Paenibacillus nanensis TaxID=393251 RepID=A0A3A1UPV0_9BACL|nr:SgcJ/EcaC family oxidoreductase [Paenibacillus nanensis]RIX49357.1 SgcJ/EcaC family oxidoreductase [Paenibacillus nanensis]
MKSPIRNKAVMNPEKMNAAFAEAYNSGDIGKLLALYEPDGILVNPNGGHDNGIVQIRKTLEDLLQLQGSMISKNIYYIPFENIALLRAHYVLHTVGTDGNPMQIQGHTTEIVRKQQDGSWLYIIDHPYGAELLREVDSARINDNGGKNE